MDIGKIIGTVVATRKDPCLIGTRLLMIQPLDESGESIGTPLVAVDTQGVAGYDDVIYMVTGGDAVSVLPNRRMPVDVLKVHRTVVADLPTDPALRTIVSANAQMAHELGLTVVAEGVEDAEHLAILLTLGGDIGQGLFFARPDTAEAMPASIRRIELEHRGAWSETA